MATVAVHPSTTVDRQTRRPSPIPSAAGVAAARVARIDQDEAARRAVDAVIAGDRDAFAVLVERDLPAVTRLCYRVLGNRDDAEEAAQETFVAAYRSLPDWRGDGPFAAWISRIALHVALRRARRTRPVDWIDVAALEGPDEVLDGGGRRVARHLTTAALDAADRTDPGAIALATERDAIVRDAVRSLEEPYREAVALRYFAELTVPEIAEACNRPQGTVKTHLHRGLLRLRERIEQREAVR